MKPAVKAGILVAVIYSVAGLSWFLRDPLIAVVNWSLYVVLEKYFGFIVFCCSVVMCYGYFYAWFWARDRKRDKSVE